MYDTGFAPLVGLMGYAQSGKDTFGAALGWHRIAFADALKDVALASGAKFKIVDLRSAPPVPLAHAINEWGWEKCKSTIPGVREFLQDLGLAVRDHIDPDAWVTAAFRKYDPTIPTVITDVRFPNEVKAIKSRGGMIVRIVREGGGAANDHISEQYCDAVRPDYTVTAPDNGVEVLKAEAEKFMWWASA